MTYNVFVGTLNLTQRRPVTALLQCSEWWMWQSIADCIRPYCCADGDDLTAAAGKRVIVCTCSTAGIFYTMNLLSNHFTHVFVDEVGFDFCLYNNIPGFETVFLKTKSKTRTVKFLTKT